MVLLTQNAQSVINYVNGLLYKISNNLNGYHNSFNGAAGSLMNFKGRTFRKKKQNKLSFICISLVALMLVTGLTVDGIKISKKISAYEEEKQELDDLIAKEKTRQKSLKQLKVYVTTNEFKAETAESSIGIVKDNEILFRTDDSK